MMDGFLLVDKPIGLTSHDVVAKVRSILRYQAKSLEPRVHSKGQKLSAPSSQLPARGSKIRVGHTGTLDPLASGLLILVLGSYTKRAQEFSKMDKTYEVELTLGSISATGDGEGPITGYSGQVTGDSKKPSDEEVRKVLKTFLGDISQTPHTHSAVKVGGQRAYRLARRGEKVNLEPRKVVIYEIRNMKYEYPKLWFTAEVSSGTYIRSLAEDIGHKLGTGAYVSALRRTKVGKFSIGSTMKLDNLSLASIENNLHK